MTTPTAELRWAHVALNCLDQQATEDFYQRWFDFDRARVVSLGDSQVVFLRHGEVLLELFEATGPAAPSDGDGPATPGITRHLAFQTDDLDAFLERIGDAARITAGPMGFDSVIPGWRSVWLLDPDGVVVEVSQGYHDQEPHEMQEGSHA